MELSCHIDFVYLKGWVWNVVEGVSHSYVAKGHLISGQVKEKEGGMAVWDHPGKGEDLKVLWASHTWR